MRVQKRYDPSRVAWRAQEAIKLDGEMEQQGHVRKDRCSHCHKQGIQLLECGKNTECPHCGCISPFEG